MKKQIRTLTDIAAILAVTLVMAVALLPVGLMGSEELKSEIPAEMENTDDESEPVSAEPSETTSTDDAVQTVPSETTTEATTAQTTTEETQPPATTQTTTAATTAQTTTQPPQSSWTEQEVSGVMYVNTDGIYSREIAVIGSAKIRQYSLNEAVTVVALTDSDYYKLDDGTFIHSDYLSYSETTVTDDETETDTDEQTDDPSEITAETDDIEDDVVPLSVYNGIQSMALEMFDMTNEYRAQYGLPALQWDYSAYPAAQIRAEELLQRNSHIRPDGTRFSTVYGDIGYIPSANGENIVYYHATARPAFDTLINSPSHRELILSSEYTHVSIAYVYDPNSYWGYYWVQEFTTP